MLFYLNTQVVKVGLKSNLISDHSGTLQKKNPLKPLVIRLPKSLTVNHLPSYHRILKPSYLQKCSRIHFDFGDTLDIDSAGIGLLIYFRSKIMADNPVPLLVNVNNSLKTYLTVMNLNDLFELERGNEHPRL